MAEVSMPRLSDTMEEGTIASWLKQPGEQISKGDVIAQIETDKATMDLTSFEAGTLEEILAPAGTTVAIGQPVARIGNGKATASKPASTATPPAPPAESPPAAPPQQSAPPSDAAPGPDGAAAGDAGGGETPQAGEASDRSAGHDGADGKVRASPMARHVAAEHGLDLSRLTGSGPQGRVILADVEAAVASPQSEQQPADDTAPSQSATERETASATAPQAASTPEAASSPAPQPASASSAASSASAGDDGDERVALSQMRRTIARRMAESTSTVPHFFLTTTVDVTDLVALRKQILTQTADAGVKVTFGDLVVKGAALALRLVPDVNVSFAGDSLIRHQHIHIGIAVATDRGLIVPVLRDADQKSLSEINRQTVDLAERARSGKLQPTDYSGGTFTISNLGMFGVEQFNAVINPPEAAILAVGAIIREPAEHAGQIVLREHLKLTLSVDHRALDGAAGARYLKALRDLLERPMLLLV